MSGKVIGGYYVCSDEHKPKYWQVNCCTECWERLRRERRMGAFVLNEIERVCGDPAGALDALLHSGEIKDSAFYPLLHGIAHIWQEEFRDERLLGEEVGEV